MDFYKKGELQLYKDRLDFQQALFGPSMPAAGDFFGEYMAGGIMILLGMNGKSPLVGDYVGTGMCHCR